MATRKKTDSQEYGADSILVLDDRSHVRLRTQIYMGNMNPQDFVLPDFSADKFETYSTTFVPGAFKAVGEIIDNCTDEFARITDKRERIINIKANPEAGEYSVSDNGRGVPIEVHSTGPHTPQVVFGQLKSGRNFTDDRPKGVNGMNGVGSAVTNYTCKYFNITINRDNKQYEQQFINGGETITEPVIKTKRQATTGTRVDFALDPEVYSSVAIDERTSRNRAIYVALMNNNVSVNYNDETFCYKRGLEDYVERIAPNAYSKFTFDTKQAEGEVYIVHTGSNDDAQVFTWVNSSLLLDGGLCNTQFMNALTKKTIEQLQPKAKKLKSEVTAAHVRKGLVVFMNLKLSDPEFDNQAKIRQTGPDLRKDMNSAVDEAWTKLCKDNSAWLDAVLDNATAEFHRQEDAAAAKGLEERIKRHRPPESLTDATDTFRMNCRLLVMEGNSAKATSVQARDAKTTGAFAMSGKFNNVHGATVAQLLKMGKIADLLASIGLVPGKKAQRDQLRYGRIVISTDADYDGQDIFCNFVNLFYTFWPELLDPRAEPFLYKLVVPNVVASKGDKRVHFRSRPEYEKVASKYQSGWTIEYMKGLGSMTLKDWRMVLQDSSYELPVVADENMKETLDLLFNHSRADDRKEWMQK